MPDPVRLEIPHSLGKAGARARIDAGIGQLAGAIPGGQMTGHALDGDTMAFSIAALGQTVASRMEVREDRVVAEIDLPPLLALFADKIREKLAKEAPKLLR